MKKGTIAKLENPTAKTNHLRIILRRKTKEKQPEKGGVTKPWPNIIANLKWRLFSIVATSLFVIYFISLGRVGRKHRIWMVKHESEQVVPISSWSFQQIFVLSCGKHCAYRQICLKQFSFFAIPNLVFFVLQSNWNLLQQTEKSLNERWL